MLYECICVCAYGQWHYGAIAVLGLLLQFYMNKSYNLSVILCAWYYDDASLQRRKAKHKEIKDLKKKSKDLSKYTRAADNIRRI